MSDRTKPKRDLEPSYLKAKHSALRLLSYRSRSEKEVHRRLQGRFTEDAINHTISDLREHGLQMICHSLENGGKNVRDSNHVLLKSFDEN